jgi:putative glutamine amidotransferase
MTPRVAVTYGNAEKLIPYETALQMVGLEPVRNPASLEGLDGLLLTGGTDLDPQLYGEAPHPETQTPDVPRDQLEKRLLQEALQKNKPVLAICRGIQLFNVVHGGTLLQHIVSEAHTRKDVEDAHAVSVAPETKLAAIIGHGEHTVNSRHHQAVGKLGKGLRVAAISSSDNIIEAVERPDLDFAVAVQWHPEDRCARVTAEKKLFEAFAEAVRAT